MPLPLPLLEVFALDTSRYIAALIGTGHLIAEVKWSVLGTTSCRSSGNGANDNMEALFEFDLCDDANMLASLTRAEISVCFCFIC